MTYSIVVPARNEAQTIAPVLRQVREMTDDLVVIDGHSTDETAAIAAEFGARVIQDNGRGKGDAIRVAKRYTPIGGTHHGWRG